MVKPIKTLSPTLPIRPTPDISKIQQINPVQAIQPVYGFKSIQAKKDVYNNRRKHIETYLANYNDPTELNSFIDALTNREAVSKVFGDAWGTISTASGHVAVGAYIASAILSAASWLVSAIVPGDFGAIGAAGTAAAKALTTAATAAKVTAAVAAVPAIPAAAKVTYDYGIKPIIKGKPKEALLNTLMNVSETMDYAANPIKGLILEGPTGFAKGTGLTNAGRVNYDYDTGNFVTDMLLEIVSDPMNMLQWTTSSVKNTVIKKRAKTVANTFIDGTVDALNVVIKNTQGLQIINDIGKQKIRKGMQRALQSVANTLAAARISKDYTEEGFKELVELSRLQLQDAFITVIKEQIPNASGYVLKTAFKKADQLNAWNTALKEQVARIQNIQMGDLVPNTVLALESFTTSLEGLDKFINKAALFSSSYGGALQLLMHKKLPIRKSLTHLRNKIIKKGVDAYKYFHKDIVGLKDLSKYTEAKAYVKAHYLAFEKQFWQFTEGVEVEDDLFLNIVRNAFQRDQQLIRKVIQDHPGKLIEQSAALDAVFQKVYRIDFKSYIGYLEKINNLETGLFKNFTEYSKNIYNNLIKSSTTYALSAGAKTSAQLYATKTITDLITSQTKVIETLHKIAEAKTMDDVVECIYSLQLNSYAVNAALINDPNIYNLFSDIVENKVGAGAFVNNIADTPEKVLDDYADNLIGPEEKAKRKVERSAYIQQSQELKATKQDIINEISVINDTVQMLDTLHTSKARKEVTEHIHQLENERKQLRKDLEELREKDKLFGAHDSNISKNYQQQRDELLAKDAQLNDKLILWQNHLQKINEYTTNTEPKTIRFYNERVKYQQRLEELRAELKNIDQQLDALSNDFKSTRVASQKDAKAIENAKANITNCVDAAKQLKLAAINFSNMRDLYDGIAACVFPKIEGVTDDAFKRYIIDQIFGFKDNVTTLLANFENTTLPDLILRLENFLDINFTAEQLPIIQSQITNIFKSYLQAQQAAGIETLNAAILPNVVANLNLIAQTFPEYTLELTALTEAAIRITTNLKAVREINLEYLQGVLLGTQSIFEAYSKRELADYGLALRLIVEQKHLDLFDITDMPTEQYNLVQYAGKRFFENLEACKQYQDVFTDTQKKHITEIYSKIRDILNAEAQSVTPPSLILNTYAKLKVTTDPIEQLATLIELKKVFADNADLRKLWYKSLAELNLPDSVQETLSLINNPAALFTTTFAWDATAQSAYYAERELNEDMLNIIDAYDNITLAAKKTTQSFEEAAYAVERNNFNTPKVVRMKRFIKPIKDVSEYMDWMRAQYAALKTVVPDKLPIISFLEEHEQHLSKYFKISQQEREDTLEELLQYLRGEKHFKQDPPYLKNKKGYVYIDEVTPFWQRVEALNKDIQQAWQRYKTEYYNTEVSQKLTYWDQEEYYNRIHLAELDQPRLTEEYLIDTTEAPQNYRDAVIVRLEQLGFKRFNIYELQAQEGYTFWNAIDLEEFAKENNLEYAPFPVWDWNAVQKYAKENNLEYIGNPNADPSAKKLWKELLNKRVSHDLGKFRKNLFKTSDAALLRSRYHWLPDEELRDLVDALTKTETQEYLFKIHGLIYAQEMLEKGTLSEADIALLTSLEIPMGATTKEISKNIEAAWTDLENKLQELRLFKKEELKRPYLESTYLDYRLRPDAAEEFSRICGEAWEDFKLQQAATNEKAIQAFKEWQLKQHRKKYAKAYTEYEKYLKEINQPVYDKYLANLKEYNAPIYKAIEAETNTTQTLYEALHKADPTLKSFIQQWQSILDARNKATVGSLEYRQLQQQLDALQENIDDAILLETAELETVKYAKSLKGLQQYDSKDIDSKLLDEVLEGKTQADLASKRTTLSQDILENVREQYRDEISRTNKLLVEKYQEAMANMGNPPRFTPWDTIKKQQEFNKLVTQVTNQSNLNVLYQILSMSSEQFTEFLAHTGRYVVFFEDDLAKNKTLKNAFNRLKNNLDPEKVHHIYNTEQQMHFFVLDKKQKVEIDGRQITLNGKLLTREYTPRDYSGYAVINEFLQADSEHDIVQLLNNFDENLRTLTGSSIGYSQGEPMNAHIQKKLYEQFPDEVKALLDEDELLNTKRFQAYMFNESVIGTSKNKAKLGINSSNMLINMQNAITYAAQYARVQTEVLHTVFDDMWNIGNKAGMYGNISDEDLLKALQNTKEYVLVTHAEHSKYGTKVHEIIPLSVKDIKLARERGAVVLPLQIYKEIQKMTNRRLGSEGALKWWNRFLYVFKFGYLIKPGAWSRNWIDTNFKTDIELGTSARYYKKKARLILREYEEINKFIASRDPQGYITHKAIQEYFQTRTTQSPLTIELYYDILNTYKPQGILGNIMSDSLEEGADLWSTFTHYTGAIIDTVNKTEEINRVAILLAELDKGASSTTALTKIATTHFDYSYKTTTEQLLEMIFPFSTYILNNFSYWVEALEKHPWLLRNYVHFMKPHWDFKDYTPEQLATNYQAQNQIINGQLKLGEFNDKVLLFKMNPSLGSALQFFSDPINDIYERLAAPLKAVESLATGTNYDITNIIPILGSLLQSGEQMIDKGTPVPSLITTMNKPRSSGNVKYRNKNLSGINSYKDKQYRRPNYTKNVVYDSYNLNGTKNYRARFYPIVDIAHEIKMRYTTNISARIKNRVKTDVYNGIRYRIRLDTNRFRS